MQEGQGFLSKPAGLWVLGAAFVQSFLLNGMCRLSGLLFVACIREYGVTRKEASLPFFLNLAVRNGSGPLVGYLGVRFGLREVTVIGCLLSSVGVAMCFFAEGMVAVTIFWGVVYGHGLGLGGLLVPQILSGYFKEHIDKANGIYLAGNCFGSILLPFLGDALLRKYGISGTFLILGGTLLHSVPLGNFLKEIPREEMHATTETMPLADDLAVPLADDLAVPLADDLAVPLADDLAVPLADDLDKGDGTTSFYQAVKIESEPKVLNQQLAENESKNYCKFNLQSFPRYADLELKCKEHIIQERIEEKNEPNTLTTANMDIETKLSPNVSQVEACLKKSSATSSQNLELQNAPDSRSGTSADKDNNLPPRENSKSVPPFPKPETDFCNSSTINYIDEGKNPTHLSPFPKKQNSPLGNFQVFLDPAFILLLVTQGLTMFINMAVWTVVVDVANDKGVGEREEVYLLVIMSIVDMLGRLVLGGVTDGDYISKINFSVLCFASLGLTLTVFVWVEGFVMVTVVMCVASLCMAGQVMVNFGVVKQHTRKEFITMAASSRYLLYVPMSFTQPFIIGFFRESLQSYDGLFYLLTAVCFLASVLSLAIPPTARFRDRKISYLSND